MIFKKEQTKDTFWAIWRIDESKEELLSMLDDEQIQEEILALKSEKKIIERLAVRVLIKEMTGEEIKLHYYPSGRPYLKDRNQNISISHTNAYVAVVLSSKKYAGIDIQYITDKVLRVRQHFVSEEECIDPKNEVMHLLLHWSAKETIYKALGTPGVDLLKELYIHPFEPKTEGIFSATERRTESKMTFDIHYILNPHFVFTITLK